MYNVFNFGKPTSFEDVISVAAHKSPIIKEIWFTAACATMVGLETRLVMSAKCLISEIF